MVIEVFPPSLRKLWKEWELRLIILLSLACQIILMLLGNRKRYTKNHLLQITVWAAYFAADSLAVFALGAISSDLNDAALHAGPTDARLELEAFWTPFFLLHLGGVDTITAYSPEDNELWSRQLLDFVVQTGLVIYILPRAPWSGSHLSILSILMLVAGIINYGERSYALWRASYKQREAGVGIGRIIDLNNEQFDQKHRHAIATSILTEHLFADVPEEIWIGSLFPVMGTPCRAAVELLELGLALMYDSLYMKTKVSHSAWGATMRCTCFLLTCISLVLFCVLNNKEKYSKIDLSITFALLTMAVLKVLHEAFVLLTSYTILFWLTFFTASKTNVIYASTWDLLKRITAFSWLRSPKWSNSMGQCSLLSYFLKEEPKGWQGILKLLSLRTKWKKEEKLHVTCHVVPVPDDMKQWMYDIYLNTIGVFGHYTTNKFGDIYTLKREDPWRRILLWHFVTEICYSLDVRLSSELSKETSRNMMYSKYISRYMMYLVVTTPEMLSSGWEQSQQKFSNLVIQVQKLCTATVAEWSYEVEEAIDDTQTSKTREVRIRARGNFEDECRKLESMGSTTGYIPESTLRSSARLLELLKPGQIKGIETPGVFNPTIQERWQLLRAIWMEMLTDTANQCRANQHAQLLSQGGELLTFAWALRVVGRANSSLPYTKTDPSTTTDTLTWDDY